MKRIKNTSKEDWDAICERPTIDSSKLNTVVDGILTKVESEGDQALREYALEFDNVEINDLIVSDEEINLASTKISDELKNAIQLAKSNIEKFHKNQQEPVSRIHTTQGVECWRENRAIEKVGLYIPGGTAPLFSTVLMLGVPANIAGCKEIILCLSLIHI